MHALSTPVSVSGVRVLAWSHETCVPQEAALYVVSTKTTEEAIRIFTEGLKPVRGVRKTMSSSTDSSSDDDVDLYSSQDSTPTGARGGTGCRRHGHSVKKDIATAPF
ncbi:uncharacterized protein LOC106866775 isoform X2 [Brachypodium distachyon]|uniref:uncharacterized protein LOC106866775 isoform X2 n=1 Tax=Brachypodium distachyon TaxID=15368 RepID=UPI000D0D7B21|nr:uncharacterized protein LOC106866775 isoform X2 [Brachypodium distachyon]|eukprot:XP_024318735.1 uncharacterized protein LOC106866775 isoform X2 [Brachypodium distachyon]